jgi:OOP family OmpA-OmpF porin
MSRDWLVPIALSTALAACSPATVQMSGFPVLAVTAKAPVIAVPLKVEKIEITEKIQFEVNKARIKPASFGTLDGVVKVMNERPTIKVEVEGHTDTSGDAEKNRALSQQRAESVLEYLIKKGIARERLTAKGFGPDKPIASNDTAEGRETNRRVEFSIVGGADRAAVKGGAR